MIELDNIKPDMIANNLEPFELNDIVNGKRAVNTKFALLCEAALGIPAHILMGLQADYDMLMAKRDKSFLKKLESIKKVAAVF